MPTGSSIGAEDTNAVFGNAATVDVDANLALDAEAISIDGIATASSVSTDSVGMLDSSVVAGADALIDIDEVGSLTASANTVNRQNVAGANATNTAVGDLLVDRINGTPLGYVTSVAAGAGSGTADDVITWDGTPFGSGTGSDFAGNLDFSFEIAASSAVASFTGATGGIIDTASATDVDLTVGDGATITVDVGNLADADATNIDGAAVAVAAIAETFGLADVGVSVGASGSLIATVDADALASATSVGDPTVTDPGSGADVTAAAVVGEVAAISDLGDGVGDFVFGDNATITARAGTSADRITVSADASTETGNAFADADSTRVAGIYDTQGSGASANVLQVGNDGTITGTAFSDFDAMADTTSGEALARSQVDAALGIQVDEIVVGDGGVVQGQADTQITVSANTVQGIGSAAGAANANAILMETKGLNVEELTIGNDAVRTGSYGVLGRVDADLVVSATTVGDGTDDVARADGQVDGAAGLELGNGGAADTALSVGDNATVAGVAEVTAAVTASSVDGNTEAVAKLGADDGTVSGDAALGIDLNDAAEIGSNGTILAQALVDLDATATTQAGVAGSGVAGAYAGAELVAGLDIDMANGDVTSIGADGTITALADVNANAVASSTEGNAEAEAGNLSDIADGLAEDSTMSVVGLQANETLAIGDAGSINADASVDLVASAASISGGADAAASLTNAAGLEQGELLTIGADGTIDADSVITGAASATTVGDGSDDSAEAQAVVFENAGANTLDVSIGANGTFTATADSTQTAAATSVAGTAEAGARSFANLGLDLDGTTTIGANGTLRGEALSDNTARAESTAESALSDVVSISNVGVGSTGAINVGAGGSLTGVADLDQAATAITVGDDAGVDQASAQVVSAANLAVALEGNASIGDTGTVIGDADLDASASATAVEADTAANVAIGSATAVDLGPATTLSIGDAGTIGANSRVGTTASASTTDGDANAAIDVVMTAGLGDGSGTVTIGSAGVVDADAVAVNSATAAAIDADGAAVEATINNDLVQAINLTGLTAGSNLALDADASSTQVASASNIGDPTVGGGEQAATAQVGQSDEVYGISSTPITVGGTATQLTSSATLSGTATASNMSGSSTATAGDQSQVVALETNSNVVVGDSATAGMAFQAVSNLTANASSIEDAASAFVGADDTYGSGTATIAPLTAASVTGVDNSNLTVGEDAGTILATASSMLNATASTNGTDGGDINATALAAMTADGLLDSAVVVGDDGNLTASATLNGTATATNIGDVADNDDDAFAQIQLNADGLQQTSAETVTIGSSGNVTGQALVDGGASATTVSGSAEAKGNLDAFGINLDNAAADITIGESGNISGLAVVGELSGGLFSDQIDILATANLQDATALGNVQAAGISGVGGVQLTAGPSDGDVSGRALAGVNLSARTIGDPTSVTATADNAVATLQPSTIAGIENVDILGGMVGTNQVLGTSFGDFDVLAESVKGNATGSSTTNAYGIFDQAGDGDITLSGNVQAIAQLSNTVTARTIEGNAVATATGNAIGLGGYNITIIGSGSLTASANSSSRSLAESVGGRASA